MKNAAEQSGSPSTGLRFHRRAMLKMMMALPVAGLVPRASFAEAARSLVETVVMPGGAASWKLRALTPQEWTTVGVLSDWIIPADDESGSATDAGVPEFIDDWLDFQRGELLAEIQGGLAWLDTECSRLHGSTFVNCTSDEQRQMLDRIAWPERTAADDAQGVAFFSRFRDLVLSGFYTSEAGIRYLPYVGNQPQRGWQGCPAPVVAQLGVTNVALPLEQTLPSQGAVRPLTPSQLSARVR